MPKVTIKRVKSLPRKIVAEQSAPKTQAAADPTTKPSKGSGCIHLANSAAVYAPNPKNEACPNDTMPL